jgi:hypothetical protein
VAGVEQVATQVLDVIGTNGIGEDRPEVVGALGRDSALFGIEE